MITICSWILTLITHYLFQPFLNETYEVGLGWMDFRQFGGFQTAFQSLFYPHLHAVDVSPARVAFEAPLCLKDQFLFSC